MRRRGGLLALQLHAGPPMQLEVKNVQLKRLKLEDKKKIVLVAGRPSHGPGEHEHNAGCLLLAKCLNESAPAVLAAVYQNGWPKDPTAFDNADGVVMYCDGGRGHMALPHLAEVEALSRKGAGVACLHYGVEPADDQFEKPNGRKEFLDWIGGYFETRWSVNPHWTAEFKALPDHPVARGVKPFKVNDEWYFFMRFRPEMKGVTPILSAVAPPETMSRPDGTHSGNPHVRESVKRGDPQVVAWTAERAGGGRGFGFTGGHFHRNWGDEDFRKLVLNALLWISGAEVPANGVESKPPSPEELKANLDKK
ncbi:MAG: ThuA domain-containing protein [Planctomycetes bacterium]|nr:ThuA domain-containing protein [Planctomycetota bacterium]